MVFRLRESLFCLLASTVLFTLAQIDEPAIVTEGNGIRIQSPGDVVIQAEGVQFKNQNGETAVPPGLKGQKGDTGATGDQGPQGERGPVGAVGPKGSQGIQGIRGARGAVGPSGSQGQQGSKGERGDAGPKGEVGPKGGVGLPGITGGDGPAGRNGLRGERGDPGVCRDSHCADGSPLSWNQCVFNRLNNQKDYGLLAGCNIIKKQNDTLLRVSWDGNMRITRCQVCCMRWALLIDGDECSDPAAIDAIVYQSSNYHMVRQSFFTGICRRAGNRDLNEGNHNVQLFLYDCPGFDGYVYDAYTGWNSISRIIVEEMYPSAIETAPHNGTLPDQYIYKPNYCQYTYTNLSSNRERNLGHIANITFNKQYDGTALKVTWEGNFRKKRCTTCCLQWFITIDGFACSAYEDIRTSISSATSFDLFFPTTLTGYCVESGGAPITSGKRLLKLEVGNCDGSMFSDGASGFSQSSRFIVEEVPVPGYTPKNADMYSPFYAHCAFNSVNDGTDSGRINRTTCRIKKQDANTALKIAFNGNMRITGCSDCCARWYVTVDGTECSPPIEGVVYSANGSSINIHRAGHLVGLCSATEAFPDNIPVGPHAVHINVGVCDGFNDTFNAYTGFSSISTMTIEEVPTTYTGDGNNFSPNIKECVSTIVDEKQTAVNTSVSSCVINKEEDYTVLKASWYGNIALEGCAECCMRWYLTIDGQECTNPEVIDGAIKQDLQISQPFLSRRPAAISGICYGPNEAGDNARFPTGAHTVDLFVGPCDGSNETFSVFTGYNSNNRFILEEIPPPNADCVEGVI